MKENSTPCADEAGPCGTHQALLTRPQGQEKGKCCHQVRRIGSKGALLVIAWTVLVSASLINPAYHRHTIFLKDTANFSGATLIICGILVLIGPVAGLSASIYYGRFKVLYAGLWLMWTWSAFTVLLSILQWFLPESQQILSYFGLMIEVGLYCVGLALYVVLSVPFAWT